MMAAAARHSQRLPRPSLSLSLCLSLSLSLCLSLSLSLPPSLSPRVRREFARIFQHELDHLDGVLYTSRMIPESYSPLSVLMDERERAAIESSALQIDEERRRQGIRS